MLQPWIPQVIKDKWYAEASAALELQEQSAPEDARFPFLLAGLHERYGDADAAQSAYERANELSPNKQGILLPLAALLFNRNDFGTARTYAEQAFTLEPSYVEARRIYTLALVMNGEFAKAQTLIEEVPEIVLEGRILRAYILQEQYDIARTVWERMIVLNPNDPNVIFALAIAYGDKGDFARARAEIGYVMQNYPGMSVYSEQLLQQINAVQTSQ